MADFEFVLSYTAIYDASEVDDSDLDVIIKFNYAGLVDEGTAPIVTAVLTHQLDSVGNDVDPGLVSLANTDVTLDMTGSQGIALTTLTIPALDASAVAVVVSCQIRIFLNVVGGATTILLRPEYNEVLLNPANGMNSIPEVYKINNSTYKITSLKTGDASVGASGSYPSIAGLLAESSTIPITPTPPPPPLTPVPAPGFFDIVVQVPITIVAPTSGTTPVYLGLTFYVPWLITK